CGDVFCAAVNEIAMDLVGNQEQIMPLAKSRQSANLIGRPKGAARIVRTAEKDSLCAGSQPFTERIEVHNVTALSLHKLCIENLPLIGKNNAAERVIGRRKDDNLIARLADGLKDEAQPGNDTRDRAYPPRLDAQAMPLCHPLAKRSCPA